MKKTCYFVFAIILPFIAQSQNFANGSFEQNSVRCGFNLTNDSFNVRCAGVHAFGAASQLDLIKDSCGYGLAQDGRYFLGLAVDTAGQHDALSLNLTTPIIAGKSYQLSWYERKVAGYATTSYGFFGSIDSSTNGGFGVAISAPPTDTMWHMRTQTFTALASYKYITVQTSGNTYSWVHLDNLKLSPIQTGIETNTTSALQLRAYPNPASTLLHFELAGTIGKCVNIRLLDIIGRTVFERAKPLDKLEEINLSAIPTGSYTLHILYEGEDVYRHIIVCK